jgi:hypothetical protein
MDIDHLSEFTQHGADLALALPPGVGRMQEESHSSAGAIEGRSDAGVMGDIETLARW